MTKLGFLVDLSGKNTLIRRLWQYLLQKFEECSARNFQTFFQNFWPLRHPWLYHVRISISPPWDRQFRIHKLYFIPCNVPVLPVHSNPSSLLQHTHNFLLFKETQIKEVIFQYLILKFHSNALTWGCVMVKYILFIYTPAELAFLTEHVIEMILGDQPLLHIDEGFCHYMRVRFSTADPKSHITIIWIMQLLHNP